MNGQRKETCRGQLFIWKNLVPQQSAGGSIGGMGIDDKFCILHPYECSQE